MFIKLNFANGLGNFSERIVKISRIKEVRPDKFHGARVLMDKDRRFQEVKESADEIFGIIKPKKGATDK